MLIYVAPFIIRHSSFAIQKGVVYEVITTFNSIC